MPERRTLLDFDVETVRLPLERRLLAVLESEPGFAQQRRARVPSDPAVVRRRLLAQGLRLTESMAVQAHQQAREAARVLGVRGELELYQRAGRENPALHLVRAPILLELQDRLLGLLDEGAAIALFGHELGHFLAHGPSTELGATLVTALAMAEQGLLGARATLAAGQLAVARELTADRVGLLATQDLEAALRLELVAITGLRGEALAWDTKAYLAQCRALMEATLASDGAAATASTHPEHGLRAWALWLFAETAEYRALTGQGPGTRALAEVDALVERALGGTRIELGYDVRDEPPAFLAEVALAGAVLVAHADGELLPEELEAIEDAFAERVPRWAELLDPDVALARFHVLAGLVRAGGPDLARALFLLLVHVMGADGVVEAREAERVLAIGEALGVAAEFRRWLGGALAAMAAPLDVQALPAGVVPLPVRRDEVRDALAALGESVARHGQLRLAPRRLLRLAGSAIEDADARARIERVLALHHVECIPPLPHAGLDELVLLRSTAPAPASEPTPPQGGSRQAVIEGITRLRDELVTGDGRSPAVRLRALAAARAFDLHRLEMVRAGAGERALTLLMAGKPAPLVTADDAGRHDAAHACVEDLRQLHRTHRDRREETGANDLYLGYPVVVGNVAPRGQTSPGYGVRAPLLLVPVELERDGRGARGFSATPRDDEDPVVNQSLLRVLFHKAALAFPDALGRELDELAGDPAGGVDAVLAKLAEVGLPMQREHTTLGPFRERDADLDEHAPFLAVEECALLGVLPQSSSDLLQDYDALLPELADPARSLETLLGAGVGLLPAEARGEGGAQAEGVGAHGAPSGAVGPSGTVLQAIPAPDRDALRWPAVPADPSQREVAAQCRRHRVTVVDGPPGTGKSQLIVNLVADALRRGERVAVVAEKRAALDVVYQRLDGCGLTDSVALVHDVGDDRKRLYRQIEARLQLAQPRLANDTRAAVLAQEHALVTQRLHARRAALAHREPGVELTVGQLLSTIAGEPAPSVPVLADLDRRGVAEVIELVERLHPHRALWSPQGWWRAQAGTSARPSLAILDDAGLVALRRAVDQAVPLAEALDVALAGDPVDRGLLDRAGPVLARLRAEQAARFHPADAAAFAALLRWPDAPVEDTRRLWSEQSSALARFATPTSMAVDDAFARDVAVLRSFAGRLARVFSGAWWRARGAVRRGLPRAWPEQAATSFSPAFLAALHDRLAAARAWEASARLLAGLSLVHHAPRDAAEGRARLEHLGALQAQARATLAEAATLTAVGVPLPAAAEAMPAFESRLAARHAQHVALHELRRALAAVQAVFPWIAVPTAAQLRELSERLAHDAHALRQADGWLARLDALTLGGRPLLDLLATSQSEASAGEWREATARAWATARLDRMKPAVPALADLGTAPEAQRARTDAEALRRLDAEIRALELARLHASLDDVALLQVSDAAYRERRTPEQKLRESLLKEVGKKRQLWPMRRLVREFAPQGLLDVMPCWLVSPETMVVLFPRQPLFDLVIFDEASQCTVEAGLPVTLRGRRVVIAGDEQQMPPSSFFRLGSGGTDDEDRSDDEQRARDVLAAESLLALARARCPHVGLRWHYRCREEELIAFSNHAMYEGGLLTIPSTAGPAAPSALRWIAVEGGEYDHGVNRPEAARVVELLDELLGRTPPPTVGVVTFNLRQRETILDAIDARVEADPEFAARWAAAIGAEALDARPFVKNLESVQGDERDVIVFSLGHAPVARTRRGGQSDLYVPARFGPLGQRGGERRLNVAISRAKLECCVVASFDPKLLHVGSTTHAGPRLFKGFLELVHHLSHGRRAQAQRVLDEVGGTAVARRRRAAPPGLDGHVPLPAQLALALEQRGLPCALDLGSSDFRIPLAVGREGDPQRFVVAVMCDEGEAGEGEAGPSPFELHVHRPAVLAMRGWKVLDVTAADWACRPADVLASIEALVRGPA